MNELDVLKKEIADLKAWKESLEASHSIPLNINQAFKERLLPSSGFTLNRTLQDVPAGSLQAVDEGGAATYDVLKSPDDFFEFIQNDSGSAFNVPIYFL